MACNLPAKWLLRILRGYYPGRAGEIQILPKQPNYFGAWTHSGPWEYLQQVPMFLYGPGHVPAVGEVGRPVTMADLAPTLALYLGQDFDTPDGDPLREAVDPGAEPEGNRGRRVGRRRPQRHGLLQRGLAQRAASDPPGCVVRERHRRLISLRDAGSPHHPGNGCSPTATAFSTCGSARARSSWAPS